MFLFGFSIKIMPTSKNQLEYTSSVYSERVFIRLELSVYEICVRTCPFASSKTYCFFGFVLFFINRHFKEVLDLQKS